ncbi:biosynthetic-type acetolactate synthase large subunit [Clostridium sp. ZS2-4]|uniref:biosynthetic-type acetolactate synthase large subunit n=1 Tax=Clostridium sp. ZS2-4 TaxID=2987703 RepID=UPI00227AE0A0|nr:biosynthetic-type acetolactate synthase large subunit [Clostridium sp. ZS2-4]MCY6356304.1 biosynthetic-type acetolactate synthase large subunit [Clostridium sp. ZS2-4]
MKLKGSKVLLEHLKKLGVDTIFGYPGGAVLPIYDELYHEKEIKHILTAHEQGAAHAADGYARATGKVGVVLVTSGPGATNTVTGIATAYSDSIPMVIFTGQVAQSYIGKSAFQEVDITGITLPITKKNYLVKDVKQLPQIIEEAFRTAKEGRPGPVLVDIPKDVQTAELEYIPEELKEEVKIEENSSYESNFMDQLNEAVDAINSSKKPVIYAGGGVIISQGTKDLLNFAEKIKAPVACSLMALGAFPGNHEYFMGMVGMHGTRCANYAVTNCDLLIAIGTRFSDRVIGNVEGFAPDAKIIHIDIDNSEIGKNVDVDIPLKGDVKEVLEALIDRVNEKNENEWNAQIEHWKYMYRLGWNSGKALSPGYILNKLYELTQGECIISTEVGQNQIWAAQYFKYMEPRTFISSGGLGTMGFGLGAAIGASVAQTQKKVINVAGDGSFKMNSHELVTVARYNLPIIQLVLNNNALGMVYQWQDMFYEKRFSNTIFNNDVDFVKLSEAYGIKAVRITKNEEVEEVLKEALEMNKPIVIECMIDTEEKVYPIVPPGENITYMIDQY